MNRCILHSICDHLCHCICDRSLAHLQPPVSKCYDHYLFHLRTKFWPKLLYPNWLNTWLITWLINSSHLIHDHDSYIYTYENVLNIEIIGYYHLLHLRPQFLPLKSSYKNKVINTLSSKIRTKYVFHGDYNDFYYYTIERFFCITKNEKNRKRCLYNSFSVNA